jgi:peroxiredoxin
MRTNIALTITSLAALMLFSFSAQPAHAAKATPVSKGDQAPDFTLQDLSGKKISLHDYQGSVVLLNFWGSFCMPCRAEMPSLNNLYGSLKDKGFTIIGLSLDRTEGPVRFLVESGRLAFPICIDEGKKVYYEKYAIFALPLTFLIDKNGVIVEVYLGKQEWDSSEMIERILKLIAEK